MCELHSLYPDLLWFSRGEETLKKDLTTPCPCVGASGINPEPPHMLPYMSHPNVLMWKIFKLNYQNYFIIPITEHEYWNGLALFATLPLSPFYSINMHEAVRMHRHPF